MKTFRQTKIVATVGPATGTPARISALIRAGVDCLRFNLSHGAAEVHARTMLEARAAAKRAGRPVAILADLCGPKIRTGDCAETGVRLTRGSLVELVPGSRESRPGRIGVSYSRLAREVRRGQRVLLADGRMELKVVGVKNGRLAARVVSGGILGSRKGVNLPGARLSVPALTAKDRRDLAAVAKAEPDYVALSFVRSPADLTTCRRACRKAGLSGAGLIAKIEKPEAVAGIERILDRCDGIMVARGDLGVEMRPEEVPSAQRGLVEAAARRDRICIVATEMFESMVSSPRPTRAEVSDVANAVREGADAVMLSGETSVGKHPIRAVRLMSRVVAAAERSLTASEELLAAGSNESLGGVADILALGTRLIESRLGGAVLVAATVTGKSAFYLSKSRPSAPLLGMSPKEKTLGRMALYWGVRPVLCRAYKRHAGLLAAAERAAVRRAGARRGDYVLVVSGMPLGTQTNTLQIRRVA